MAIRRSIKSAQPRRRILAVRVDGSAVTTSAATTGLIGGDRHNMTVVKGTGGAANEVTITLNQAFAVIPSVHVTSVTTNCHVEVKSATSSVIVLEAFAVADGTTVSNDADYNVMIIGEDTASEYKK
jgi:hypothetical protein